MENLKNISRRVERLEELLQCSVCLYVPERRIYQCKVLIVTSYSEK